MVRIQQQLTPETYLAREAKARRKHEFVNGHVYLRADATNLHNLIVVNAIGSLAMRLKGKKCRPYNSDTKVRIQNPGDLRFYYPDAQVVCKPNAPDDVYQDTPTVIIEVVFKSTRRVDEGEKLTAYQSIPSVEVYLIVESTHQSVTAYTRGPQGFTRTIHQGANAAIKLRCIKTELPLTEIYEGTDLPSLEVVK